MTIELAKELIRRRSVTPDDAGCQHVIAARLQRAQFSVHHLNYDDVHNLWATHGHGTPLVALLGHTDVVPTGPVSAWTSDPFTPEIRGGMLYGRGAADMKGSVAAMVTALERFAKRRAGHRGTAALLLTSDEEGVAVNGTRRVVEHLSGRSVKIDYCLVGEPSSRDRLGDSIKNGRRGSLTGRLTVHGVQGHVAYPHLADNPIHRAAPALAELAAAEWDRGNEHYPPTTFQISNIHAGAGADNVIPGSLEVQFNLRFSTCLDETAIARRVTQMLDSHRLKYEIEWQPASRPFLTASGRLLDVVKQVVHGTTGVEPEVSTGGGTSDGRFVAPTGAEVVELGPLNRTIHKVDECVSVKDLETVSSMYEKILENLLAD